MASIAVWPGVLRTSARFAATRVRATVAIALILIAGSFAAAAALSMRFERVHALAQATGFEQQRARDLAAVIAANLARFEAAGRAFAQGGLGAAPPEGVRNIAVYAADGTPLSTLGDGARYVHLSSAIVATARARPLLIAGGGVATLVSASGGSVIAVAFDAAALVPASMLARAAVATDAGSVLLGAGTGSVRASVPGWPATVSIAPDDEGALAAWTGSLPLYLFVILGPALAGAWLAALFVGEFEKRMRASQAVQALRAAKPAEQRLLVRLAQAEREANEAQRSKAEFIAHMSHELRTPLNAVIGFSEIIEQGMFGPVGHAKYVEYARDIAAAGRGLHAKVGDILDYANLEAGRYPIALSAFDLCALASAAVEEHTGRAFSRRIALEFAPSLPLVVRADAHAVKRILTNLISNALAYTPEGGRVCVDLLQEETAAVLRVSDTGPGFKDGEARAAGNAFRRFDRKQAQTGTGLGLAIAVALAHRTGGTLNLTTPREGGTRTELRLPKA
ncbi:MAG: HAMP domain-containing histidine kinase [Alphaproteobacteria bacterium]|nr:HAMP domain-containing histidine kinase [Alphaproteobacteria bacterium]